MTKKAALKKAAFFMKLVSKKKRLLVSRTAFNFEKQFILTAKCCNHHSFYGVQPVFGLVPNN